MLGAGNMSPDSLGVSSLTSRGSGGSSGETGKGKQGSHGQVNEYAMPVFWNLHYGISSRVLCLFCFIS